jgi:hypothetical protein
MDGWMDDALLALHFIDCVKVVILNGGGRKLKGIHGMMIFI